jgi:hypothetical protein
VDREFLEQRFVAGQSLEQIGQATGLHPTTIAYWAKKHGLSPAGARRFTARGAPDREKLEELVDAGATLQELADAVDRSITTVRYWLSKWSIVRPQSSARADPGTSERIVDRICSRHGLTRFGLERRGYYRCLLCRQERVSEWRRRVKRVLVDEAGGGCQLCGYAECNAALQFHHLDPTQKQFSLSHDGVARNLAAARAEAAKCVLLCANCHAEVEAGHTVLDIAA